MGEMPPMGGMPPLPEDYDINLEKQLIVEHRKFEEAQKQLINEDRVYSSYDHYGTNLSNKISESRLHSGYTNMLNNCQLDGLATFVEDENGENQEEVLIESYLDKSEVKEAKDRARTLLTEEESAPEDEIAEITPNDLPSRRVFVE